VLAVLAAMALALVALGGCGGSGDRSSTSGDTTAPDATVEPTGSANAHPTPHRPKSDRAGGGPDDGSRKRGSNTTGTHHDPHPRSKQSRPDQPAATNSAKVTRSPRPSTGRPPTTDTAKAPSKSKRGNQGSHPSTSPRSTAPKCGTERECAELRAAYERAQTEPADVVPPGQCPSQMTAEECEAAAKQIEAAGPGTVSTTVGCPAAMSEAECTALGEAYEAATK
jgi:hypothetical protein